MAWTDIGLAWMTLRGSLICHPTGRPRLTLHVQACVYGLILQFHKILWSVIGRIAIDMMHYLSFVHGFIWVGGIPNDMRPQPLSYSDMSVSTKPASPVIMIQGPSSALALPDFLGHAPRSLISAGPAAVLRFWLALRPNTSKCSAANGTSLRRLHRLTIAWTACPCKGGESN